MRAMTVLTDGRFRISFEHFHPVDGVLVLVIHLPLRRTGPIARIMTPLAVDFLHFLVGNCDHIDMAIHAWSVGMYGMSENHCVDEETYLSPCFSRFKKVLPAMTDQALFLRRCDTGDTQCARQNEYEPSPPHLIDHSFRLA
jgi:hypothetical protein